MKFVRTIAMWRPVSRPCRRPLSPFEDALRNAGSLGGDSDTLACITGGIAEAFYGQSEADFVAKLSISQKETSETIYWLELLHESEYLKDNEFDSVYSDAEELIKLLTSSIKTIKEKMLQSKLNH